MLWFEISWKHMKILIWEPSLREGFVMVASPLFFRVLSDRYKIWQCTNIVLSGPKSDFFWPNSFWAPRNPCPKFELFDLPLNYKGKVPKMIQNWLWRILNCQSCSRYLMVFSIRIGLFFDSFKLFGDPNWPQNSQNTNKLAKTQSPVTQPKSHEPELDL